jgi:ANTAR domain
MENGHEQAVASASSGLNRAGIGLGAAVIALLEAAGSQVKVICVWRCSQNHAPERRVLDSSRLLRNKRTTDSPIVARSAEFLFPLAPRSAACALLTDALGNPAATPSAAGSPLAELLRDAISEDAQSFLSFPLRGGQKVIAGVIGFAESSPPVCQVPDVVVENLNLLGWATWSANEIARLRAELKTVNERLAGRKLVERAKGALQTQRSISEEQAYEYLRGLSRKRRITLAELSAEILDGRAECNRAELLAARNRESAA